MTKALIPRATPDKIPSAKKKSVPCKIKSVTLHRNLYIKMQRLSRHIALVLCLLAHPLAWGQWGEKPVFSIENTEKSVALHFQIDTFLLSDEHNGYLVLSAPGLTTAGTRAGAPALPTASRLLMLPRGSHLSVSNCLGTADTTVALPCGLPLAPGAAAVPKDEQPLPLHIDRSAYSDTTHQTITIEDLGSMGSKQVFRVSVHPFSYSHARRTLNVCLRIDAQLQVTEGLTPATTSFHQPTLLVVGREEFRQGLQPFVRWKRQQGFLVHELYSVSQQRDSIRSMIAAVAERHRSADMPYLLLVGDVGQLQAYIGNTQPAGFDLHITDLRYADLDGDYLPDLIAGRWPVNDTAELGAVVRKTLRYEQCIDIDSTALQRVLLVAGKENTLPAPTTTNGEVNYLKNELTKALPEIDTVCYYNPASDSLRPSLLHDIGQGAALTAYTAHCTNGGWSHPRLQATHVDSLSVEWPSVWVNNCCMSNNYGGTCFGEQLLRMPSGGAVAVIGATNNTMWNEDYYWAVGPKYPFSLQPAYDTLATGGFDPLWDEQPDPTTVGEMLLAGNLAVAAAGSPYDRFYWEIYCLLGDPTLQPQLGLPAETELALADSLYTGATTATVLTAPGTHISLMQADSLLGWAVADSDRVATVALRWCIDTGAVTLTASGAGVKPAFSTMRPGAPLSSLAFFDLHIGDSSLHCTVANMGPDTLKGVKVDLLQDSIDQAVGCLLDIEGIEIPSLAPQQRLSLAMPYGIAMAGAEPLWQASLRAVADTIAIDLRVSHLMPPSYPTIRIALLGADSLRAYSLTADASYLLRTEVDGDYDSLALTVESLPDGKSLFCGDIAGHNTLIPIATPDTITHLRISYTLCSGLHTESKVLFVVAGNRMDCLEEEMRSYPWHTAGSQPWRCDSTEKHSGTSCLRSGKIDYRQTSDLTIELDVMFNDTVSYWARTSSEEQFDKLTFSIDGRTTANTLSGESGWKRFAVPVDAGRHTLRWRYVKDEGKDKGNDCAWIDDICLPLALWDGPYGWFGNYQPLDIADATPDNSQQLHVRPNPSSSHLIMDGTGQVDWLRVTDLYGRTVLCLDIPQQLPLKLNVESLPDGVYLLLAAIEGSMASQTIIIQH